MDSCFVPKHALTFPLNSTCLILDTLLIETLVLKTPSVSVLTGCAIRVSQKGGNFLLSGTVYLMI